MFPYHKIGFLKYLDDLESGQSSSTQFNLHSKTSSLNNEQSFPPLWKQVPRSTNVIQSDSSPLLKNKDFDNLSQIKRKQVFFSDEAIQHDHGFQQQAMTKKIVKRQQKQQNDSEGQNSCQQMQVMEVLQRIQFYNQVTDNNLTPEGMPNLLSLPINNDQQPSFLIGRKAQVSVQYIEPEEQQEEEQVVRQLLNKEHHGTRSQPISALDRSFEHKCEHYRQQHVNYQSQHQGDQYPRFRSPQNFTQQMDGYDEQIYNKYQEQHVSPYFNEANYDQNINYHENWQENNSSPQKHHYKSQPNLAPVHQDDTHLISRTDQSVVPTLPTFPLFDVLTTKTESKGGYSFETKKTNIPFKKDDSIAEIQKFKNRIDSEKLMAEGQGRKDMQVQLHKLGYELDFIDKSFLSEHSQQDKEQQDQMQKIMSQMELNRITENKDDQNENGHNQEENKSLGKEMNRVIEKALTVKQESVGQNLDIPSLPMHSNRVSSQQISTEHIQSAARTNQRFNSGQTSQIAPVIQQINPRDSANQSSEPKMTHSIAKSDSVKTVDLQPLIKKKRQSIQAKSRLLSIKGSLKEENPIRNDNVQFSALDWLNEQKHTNSDRHIIIDCDLPVYQIRVNHLQITNQVTILIGPTIPTDQYQQSLQELKLNQKDWSPNTWCKIHPQELQDGKNLSNLPQQHNAQSQMILQTKQQNPFNSRVKQLEQTYIQKLQQQTEHFQSLFHQMKQQIKILSKDRQKLSDQLYQLQKELADIKSIQTNKHQEIKELQQQNQQLHHQLLQLHQQLSTKQRQNQTILFKYAPSVQDYENSIIKQAQQPQLQDSTNLQAKRPISQGIQIKQQKTLRKQEGTRKQYQITQQLNKIQRSTKSLQQQISLLYQKIQEQEELIQRSQLEKNQLYISMRKQKQKIRQLQITAELDWQQFSLKEKALQNELKILKYHLNLLLSKHNDNHYPYASINIEEMLANKNSKNQQKVQQLMRENLLKRQIHQNHPHLLSQKILKYRQNSYLNPEQQTKLIAPLNKKNRQALLSPKIQKLKFNYPSHKQLSQTNRQQNSISKYDRHLNSIDSHDRSIKLLNQIKKDIQMLEGQKRTQNPRYSENPNTQRTSLFTSVSPPSSISKAIVAKKIAMDTMNNKLQKLREQVRRQIAQK